MTDLAHLIVRAMIRPGDWAIDATVGNGHDTAFLAESVGPDGRVFGFDIQAEALAATRQRLGSSGSVTLHHASHADLADHLPIETTGAIGAIMFNLGYLPGGDKAIITATESTVAAITTALTYLRVGGIATVIVYPAHPGGAAEAAAVLDLAERLSNAFAVTRHTRLGNDRPVPELLAIERRR